VTDLMQFVIRVGKMCQAGKIVRNQLSEDVSKLPCLLSKVDFTSCRSSLHGGNFFYGITDFTSLAISQEEISQSCRIFKAIFEKYLRLSAELKIDIASRVDQSYENEDGQILDYSYCFYLITWIVYL